VASTEGQVHHLHFDIPIDAPMSGDAHLLVFFVRDDGETIADSTGFTVEPCVDNDVSVSFAHAERLPGARTQLLVKADPGSLCAVGVVDKSVHVLGGSNQLTLGKVFSLLSQFDIKDSYSRYDSDAYCENQMSRETPPRPPRRGNGPRRPRSFMPPGRYFSDYYDSSRAFQALFREKQLKTLLCQTRHLPSLLLKNQPWRLETISQKPGSGSWRRLALVGKPQ
jgi:hypothetical protein